MKEAGSHYSMERTRHGSRLHHRVDVLTAYPEVPREDTLPLLVLPGYLANANPAVSEGVAKGFADLGRQTHVVTFERFYRGRKLSKAARDRESVGDKPQKGEKSVIEYNKAVALLEYMDATGIEKADLATHSLETQAALYAISIAPERFGNGVFVAPSSLNHEYPIQHLTPRFVRQITPEVVHNLLDRQSRPATLKQLQSGTVTVALHPLRTLLYEPGTIRHTNLADIVRKCEEDPTYPDVLVLGASDDAVFGTSRLGVDHQLYSGGHNDFLAGRLTGMVDQALTTMASGGTSPGRTERR